MRSHTRRLTSGYASFRRNANGRERPKAAHQHQYRGLSPIVLDAWKGWREAPAWAHLALIVAVAVLANISWHGLPSSYVPLLAGLMVGVLYGYRHVHFSVEVAAWRRLLAAVLGALAFIGLQWALKRIGLALALEGQAWQGLRGLLMGLFVAALMPWLLVRMGLLGARPQEV